MPTTQESASKLAKPRQQTTISSSAKSSSAGPKVHSRAPYENHLEDDIDEPVHPSPDVTRKSTTAIDYEQPDRDEYLPPTKGQTKGQTKRLGEVPQPRPQAPVAKLFKPTSTYPTQLTRPLVRPTAPRANVTGRDSQRSPRSSSTSPPGFLDDFPGFENENAIDADWASESSDIGSAEAQEPYRNPKAMPDTLDGIEQEVERRNAGGEERLELNSRRVRIPRSYVTMLKSHVRAIVLSQLSFWLFGNRRNGAPRAHPPLPGRMLDFPWVMITSMDLAEQTGLTAKQVEHAIATLRKRSVISSHAMRCHIWGPLYGLTPSHFWFDETQRRSLLPHYTARDGQVGQFSLTLLRWTMAATNGDVNAALVMSRIWYLINRRDDAGQLRSRRPNEAMGLNDYWVEAEREHLANWLGLSTHQVKRAIAKLKSLGYLTQSKRKTGRRIAHGYALDFEACLKFIYMFEANGGPDP